MGQFAAPSQQITHSEKLFMQLSAMSTARSTPRYRWLEVPAAAIVGCVHFSTASLVMNTKGLNLFLERTTREQYPRIVVERKFIRLLVSWLYRNILSNSVPTDCCETRLNFRGGGGGFLSLKNSWNLENIQTTTAIFERFSSTSIDSYRSCKITRERNKFSLGLRPSWVESVLVHNMANMEKASNPDNPGRIERACHLEEGCICRYAVIDCHWLVRFGL